MIRLLLLPIFIFSGITTFSQVTFRENILSMENELMLQKISFQKGFIQPMSIFSKSKNTELLAGQPSPWFEFVINGQVITSDQPVWKFVSFSTRKINNGGTEAMITIQNTKNAKGLQVEIVRQIFPNSALVREKLTLQNPGKSKLTLNKLNGKLHFIFPRYSLKDMGTINSLTEKRIATFDKEVVDNYNPSLTWDDRTSGFNLAHCHMFHPDIIRKDIPDNATFSAKGPFITYQTPSYSWLMAYEHASQDKNYGSEFGNAAKKTSVSGIDADQGVTGASGIVEKEDDFWFLSLSGERKNNTSDLFVKIRKGGYLDGEAITTAKPYETVWAASAFFFQPEEEKAIVHHYLWDQITENQESRKSHFYYNTWGMQRDANNKTGLRDIFTEARILEEIRYASELNVDLFVLDDGWEETMGVWRPHSKRLPNGLTPLVNEMKNRNIIPGIWLSPMGIDSLSERFKNHPEWVLRDAQGKPIRAQWGFPAFDFVSGFYDLFVADCKKLVDEGIRFFKWDAINTFNSTLPDLHHGSSAYSKEEIRDRYGYMLPFYVTRAMKELREYNPEVVVEIDLTEKERCIIGLMPLQEGKLFWMNNGASAYNDYSTLRTKSMRTVINEYTGIIPTELFTQAVYPHHVRPFDAQRYHVNTTLVAGRGFWGNLQAMSQPQRLRAGEMLAKSKRVLPYISALPMEVKGKIGSSPEIYTHVNRSKGAGQVIAFSGSAINFTHKVELNTDSCVAVLNHAYKMEGNIIEIPFQFTTPDASREAFIIPNNGTGISIRESSAWLKNVTLNDNSLEIEAGATGELVLVFPSTKELKFSVPPTEYQMKTEDNLTYVILKLGTEKKVMVKW